MSDHGRSTPESLGRLEIGSGVLLFVYGTLSPMITRFYPVLEPDVLFGLWPLVLILTGALLVAAGGRLVRGKRWPWLYHVPLATWLLCVVFLLYR